MAATLTTATIAAAMRKTGFMELPPDWVVILQTTAPSG
jgi:hypothetical protein